VSYPTWRVIGRSGAAMDGPGTGGWPSSSARGVYTGGDSPSCICIDVWAPCTSHDFSKKVRHSCGVSKENTLPFGGTASCEFVPLSETLGMRRDPVQGT